MREQPTDVHPRAVSRLLREAGQTLEQRVARPPPEGCAAEGLEEAEAEFHSRFWKSELEIGGGQGQLGS